MQLSLSENKTTRRVTITIALLITLIINGLAGSGVLNNQTSGEISDMFDVFFVPAGYVFSIWGVIYLGLLAYVGYQFVNDNERLRSIAWPFVATCIFNSGWLIAWHYELWALSVVLMSALLGTLIFIYNTLEVGRTAVPTAELWAVQIPFRIYLGWVSVATIANITSVLDAFGWGGGPLPPAVWAVILLAVGVVLGGAFAWGRGDVAYTGVLVWAFAGIAVKHAAVPLVANAAWIATAAVAVLMLVAAYRRYWGPLPHA